MANAKLMKTWPSHPDELAVVKDLAARFYIGDRGGEEIKSAWHATPEEAKMQLRFLAIWTGESQEQLTEAEERSNDTFAFRMTCISVYIFAIDCARNGNKAKVQINDDGLYMTEVKTVTVKGVIITSSE